MDDDATALLLGDLAESTKLPRELLARFDEMWRARQQPFFSRVNDESLLPLDGVRELIRSLKVSSPLLCDSVARVIAEGAAAITFSTFVRGYAKLHARTLKEALPFAFAVFDLDGDGKLGQDEFKAVISANLEMQGLDAAALNRVLATTEGKDAATGVTYNGFRYFASLTSETILACCGFLLHCRDFYVPPTPLGTEEEEAAEEAEQKERHRKERERAHASPSKKGDAGGVEGGEIDLTDGGYFSDPDLLAALEQLRTTPEERAERCKAKGNEAMKNGKQGAAAAVDAYTEGLDERCTDASLMGTLYGNRAAAHTTLKNWGKCLSDAAAALETKALPNGSAIKACRRGANAALQLKKIVECEAMIKQSEELLGESVHDAAAKAAPSAPPAPKKDSVFGSVYISSAEEGASKPTMKKIDPSEIGKPAADGKASAAASSSTATPSNPEALELQKIARAVAKLQEQAEIRRIQAEAAAAREAEVAAAIKSRGLLVRDFNDENLRQQCVGANSGARVWYDAELDELHWPVLLLYPEHAQTDFIQDVAEGEALLPHLMEMFGEHGENSPPWDEGKRYAAPNLNLYAPLMENRGEVGSEAVAKLRPDLPLLAQLKELQPKGYAMPGVPAIHAVVKGSEYEAKFFDVRTKIPIFGRA